MKEFDFEKVIIKALITNDKVKTKVLPFLKEEWFGFNIVKCLILLKLKE